LGWMPLPWEGVTNLGSSGSRLVWKFSFIYTLR
jgi:hypothetical protein